MDQVFVEGVEFLGRHGVTAKERRVGIRCRADAVVDLDARPAAESGKVRHTANYARLSELLHTIGTTTSHKLLETLAWEMAGAILDEMPMVERAEVSVRKLGLVVPGAPVACGVRIVRRRE